MNAYAVLQIMSSDEQYTVAQLSEALHEKPANVRNAINQLEDGQLIEVWWEKAKRGRRKVCQPKQLQLI